MSQRKEHRNLEDLDVALGMVMMSVDMRKKGIDHNIIYVVGDPGSGKTMMSQDIVTKRGGCLKAYSPALERLEKFGGIPDIIKVTNNEGDEPKEELHTQWSVPQMITEINALSKTYPFVVVMFDDWHLCIDELQQIGFELFTYYSLNGHRVNSNVTFMLAGNETSAAGAKLQLTPIRNRCTLIYSKPNVEYWLTNYAYPNQIHPAAISFFKSKTNYEYFQEEESTTEQFGSPRSWSSAFNWIQELENNNNYSSREKMRIMNSILYGSVSPKAAEKFMIHYEIFKNIDIDKIFRNKKINIPKDNIERFCFSAAVNSQYFNLFARAKEKNDRDRMKEFSIIYGDCIKGVEKDYPELAIMMIQDINMMGNRGKYKTINGIEIIKYLIESSIFSTDICKKISKIGTIVSGSK
jgi:hypothetical protein